MMLLAVTVLNFWSPVREIEYQALWVMGATALGVFLPDLMLHIPRIAESRQKPAQLRTTTLEARRLLAIPLAFVMRVLGIRA